MPANTPSSLRLRKLLFASLLVLIGVAIVVAITQNKQWNIPEEAKSRQNPLQPSSSNLAAAGAIYIEKCANCHGETGKGNGPDAASYYPAPTNLTDTNHINSVTDGEIFYQISQGRKPMPAFKRKLSEEQRWQLVLFVRSLAASRPPSR